jgi:uncharacterized damage-inducible protein DinB
MTLATLHFLIRRELGAVRREIEAYPDDDSLWRAVPGMPNTGGTLALHLTGNLQHFFGAILAKDGFVRDRDAEFARRNVTRAELLDGLEAAEKSVGKTIRKMKDADLATSFPEPIAKRTVNTGAFLAHLATHLSYHLGQIDYHRRAVTRDDRGVDAVSVRELPDTP